MCKSGTSAGSGFFYLCDLPAVAKNILISLCGSALKLLEHITLMVGIVIMSLLGRGVNLRCWFVKTTKGKNMMKMIHTIIPVAALVLASSQTGQAVPITGNIGFSGVVQLDTGDASTATEALSWENQVVGATSGAFTGISEGTAVAIAAPWSFNSGPINDFWTVGGFTFNLLSSSIIGTRGRFLDVDLTGTVTGNGYDDTSFSGTFQVANPSADGLSKFTDRLSFGQVVGTPVPDGGITAMLLGLACAGLATMKYKLA
jgi:hypothetical protein